VKSIVGMDAAQFTSSTTLPGYTCPRSVDLQVRRYFLGLVYCPRLVVCQQTFNKKIKSAVYNFLLQEINRMSQTGALIITINQLAN